ncbi:MAG: glycoside hydrolase family 15 protein, partial [Candidatus Saccharimonadales bacterium]
MGRPVMLGNGGLTIGLNEQGLVNDFYYPYVGLDNLCNARNLNHKIGLWVDGEFSWVDSEGWDIKVDFETDAMVSTITMTNSRLLVELSFQDFVDFEFNCFARLINISNKADKKRDIRLFMHQVFQISRAGRADTGLFVPEANYILDYKGRCSLLIYGQNADGLPFDQFAIGNYGIEGKEGTFKDAEDGELSGSAVEHGGVDSVMRFAFQLERESNVQVDYWVIAADSQYRAEKIHDFYLREKAVVRLMKTRRYWRDWLAIGANGLHTVDKKYLDITKKSLMLIKVHVDKRGGIIASCDSSIYNYGRDYYSYVWPRDGAYAIWPLIRLGFNEEAKMFFEFCRDILTKEGYLMHKYQPDRSIGSTWHPLLHGKRKELAIQEDETAIVIYMLGEYYLRSHDDDFVRNLYTTFIQPAANFLAGFIDETTKLPHASYDLWEERFLTSTYSTAVVYQALIVAAEFADDFEFPDDGVRWRDIAKQILTNSNVLYDSDQNFYRKGLLLQENGSVSFDNTLDVSSLYGVMMFGLHGTKTEEIKQTANKITELLTDKSPAGGVARYQHDHYFESSPAYMGNPWFITTLWMAQFHIRNRDIEQARASVDWTIKHCLPSGVLSEQINP